MKHEHKFMGQYYLGLLGDWRLLGSKPISRPSNTSIKLHDDDNTSIGDIPTYKRPLHWIHYLNTPQPDIVRTKWV